MNELVKVIFEPIKSPQVTLELSGVEALLSLIYWRRPVNKWRLKGFIYLFESQRGRKLTEEQADYLVEGAQQLLSYIKN
jgi:hypothetical protein